MKPSVRAFTQKSCEMVSCRCSFKTPRICRQAGPIVTNPLWTNQSTGQFSSGSRAIRAMTFLISFLFFFWQSVALPNSYNFPAPNLPVATSCFLRWCSYMSSASSQMWEFFWKCYAASQSIGCRHIVEMLFLLEVSAPSDTSFPGSRQRSHQGIQTRECMCCCWSAWRV